MNKHVIRIIYMIAIAVCLFLVSVFSIHDFTFRACTILFLIAFVAGIEWPDNED